jgi:hypothetical protein
MNRPKHDDTAVKVLQSRLLAEGGGGQARDSGAAVCDE